MEENYDIIKYYNILNRLTKKTATYEGLIIIKKQYFTDNFYYYILCLLTRFIPLIALSGDYSDIYGNKNNVKSFQSYLKLFSCHNIIKRFNLSQKQYSILSIIIAILFIIRTSMNFYIIMQVKNAIKTERWPLPNKYMIIMDHIAFLVFPYIIEFLSFIVYIHSFPQTFIIKPINEYKDLAIFGSILNLILIIGYNIDNYLYIICSNRKYTITIFDAASSKYNEKKIKKKVSYKCSNHIIYIFIFLQNFVIFLTIENYFNRRFRTYFKIGCSILLFVSILIIFFSLSNTFNYSNHINLFISVILFYCFYSIILDLIISLSRNLFKTIINQILYILVKLLLSYITHIIFKKKTNAFLEKKIAEILFQETNNKKQKHFVNGAFYLHEIMLKLKEQKNIESAFYFIKFLYNHHINNCSKLVCNCKLLKAINIIEYIKSDDKPNLEDFISNLIKILNYLFESAFIDYDFYNNLDLVLILSEHFCHLRNNPIMAFSLIKTYLVKQKNKLSKFQIVSVHELAQKYSYYITSKVNEEMEKELIKDKNISLINRNKANEFIIILVILKTVFTTKKFFINYIIILINLIKYKSIFEESLSFQFDENNENITSVRSNFFEDETKIEGFFNDIYDTKKKGNYLGRNNLYNIIYLLSKELIYYNKLIKSINLLDNLPIPIFHLFKYFLLFDCFQGGNLPNEILELINKSSFKKEMNLYNSYITKKDYLFLKRKYNDESNRIDSNCHIIFEYKKELRLKYFTESFGLKLGYKQKDLINHRLDVLVPKDFCESHQNMIKHIINGSQIRHYLSKNNYIFDSTSKIIYPMDYEGILIYNIYKHLILVFKSNFIFDNEYSFMLNNNFELLSNSINFQDEYYLNQKILQAYNISLLDLLKIKTDKIRTKFENEYKIIQHQKLIRKIKAEEYFIPQFYSLPNEKFAGMMKPKYYNTSKSNYLSNIRLPNEEEINSNKFGTTQEEDEEKNILNNNNTYNSINDLLLETENIIFHKTFTTTLNKGTFIENLAKEFTKIPDNDLIFENDKTSYNCIISAKKLISKLLTKSEIANEYLKILVKLTFIYDRTFYFIKINDEKKQYLTISKNIHFGSNQKNIIDNNSSFKTNNKIKIPFNKNDNKTKNKTLFPQNKALNKKEQNKTKNNNEKENFKNNEKSNNIFINKIITKIQEYKVKINRDRLILSIKVILSLIIFTILILIIIINNIQGSFRASIKEILLSFFYNGNLRDSIIGINSRLLQIFYDYSNLAPNKLSTPKEYQTALNNLVNNLETNFHNFTQAYVGYNLLIGHDINSFVKNRKFNKLIGFWEEIEYESNIQSELNYIIYYVHTINISMGTSPESQLDFKHFFNFKDRTDTKEKIHTNFIKLLYYICVNLENYQIIFQEIDDEIYNSYKVYVTSKMILFISLGLIQIFLYILFFIIIIYYLYYCNEIIFKNIVFLFLDLSEKEYNRNNINNNLIRLKLSEFKNIIQDFDLDQLEKYSKNLDNLERNKLINLRVNAQNNAILENNQDEDNNDNINNKKALKLGDKVEEKEYSSKKLINEIVDDKYLNMKDKRILNNSSQNYLVNANANNKFLKNSINNNSMNSSKEILMISNSNNSKRNINNKSLKDPNIKEKDINDIDTEDYYQDIILDKLNRSKILMMKVFLAITLLLLVLILFSNFYSMYKFSKFVNIYSQFFQDYSTITNRYRLIFFFYNAFRMLIITPNIKAHFYMIDLMDNLNEYYLEQNNKFNKIIFSINNYNEIRKLYYILVKNKDISNEFIKENICGTNGKCTKYLESEHNLVDSGIDFGFKASVTLMGNMYMDYKNIDDKSNMTKIESSIIKSEDSQFNDVAVSLSNFFLVVKRKIYNYFLADEENFRNNYMTKISNFNITLIIMTILISVFIFYVFITISGYTGIIKEASCRINCSFFYIKIYTLK